VVGDEDTGVSTFSKKKRSAQTLAALDALRNLKVNFFLKKKRSAQIVATLDTFRNLKVWGG